GPWIARDQFTLPQPQYHTARIVAVPGDANRIGVPAPHEFDRLGLLELVEPLEGIPHLGGALEVELARRLLHALPEARAHVHRLPLEEQEHVIDHPAVLRLALQIHARRPTPLDVVVEAGALRRLPGQVPMT